MKNTYKNDLENIRFTEEGKRKLILGAQKTREKNIRFGKINKGLVAIGVLCIFTITAGAVGFSRPILDNIFPGNYEDVSMGTQKSITNRDGYTATITDILGDRTNLYIGITIEAPEGIEFDENKEYHLEFGDEKLKRMQDDDFLMLGSYDYVYNQDSSDNKLDFVMYINAFKDTKGSFIGNELDLQIGSLYYCEWKDEKLERVVISSKGFKFDDIKLDLPEDNIKLDINTQIETLGVTANVTKVEISPLGVIVKIEGENLRGHNEFPEVPIAEAGWLEPESEQEIIIGKSDGSEFEVTTDTKQFGNIILGSGSGAISSGGEPNSTEEASITIVRQYGEVLDIEEFEYIKVNGVKINIK